MATGTRIPDLPTTTESENGYIPVDIAGVTYKILASLLTNLVSGIGKETTVFSASDSYDVNQFSVGYLYSISDTEANAVAAGCPVSGLDDGDAVFWTIFTFGTNEYKTQLAFSPQADIEKAFVRFGEIGSDAVWSQWFELTTQNNPRFSQNQEDPTGTADTALTAGNPALVEADTTEMPASLNHLFEAYSNTEVRYIGKKPIWMMLKPQISGRILGGAAISTYLYLLRNGLVVPGGSRGTVTGGSTADVGNLDPSIPVLLNQYDVISNFIENPTNNQSFRCVGFSNVGEYMRDAIEDEVLGPELFENPNMTSTDGFTANNCSLSASGGELTATCTVGSSDSNTYATISGLTVTSRYRVVVKAKRGVQGVQQEVTTVFGDTESDQIALTTEEVFVYDKIAGFTTDTVTIRVGISAALNDEVIITGLSVREYL